MKLTYIALFLYAACYTILFGTWAGIVFTKAAGAEQLVTYIQMTLVGLTAHVLTILSPASAGGASKSGQGGFAQPILLGLVALMAAFAMTLTGCATSSGQALTFQQIAAQVCPPAKVAIASLSALETMPAQAHADLVKVGPLVDAVCTAGVIVDVTDLAQLATSGIPLLIQIADTAGLDPDVHDQVVLGLTVAEIAVSAAVAAQPQ